MTMSDYGTGGDGGFGDVPGDSGSSRSSSSGIKEELSHGFYNGTADAASRGKRNSTRNNTAAAAAAAAAAVAGDAVSAMAAAPTAGTAGTAATVPSSKYESGDKSGETAGGVESQNRAGAQRRMDAPKLQRQDGRPQQGRAGMTQMTKRKPTTTTMIPGASAHRGRSAAAVGSGSNSSNARRRGTGSTASAFRAMIVDHQIGKGKTTPVFSPFTLFA